MDFDLAATERIKQFLIGLAMLLIGGGSVISFVRSMLNERKKKKKT